uniref:CBM20 domain-containing protein n=1 Tax=Neogobius melanostomus TaxID=47308 RepID=A0A8C6UXY1_9GOBI
MQAETSTVSCPDIRDIEKVDDKAIQSSNEREIVESVTTSCQFEQQSEQNKSEVLLDIDNGECANFLEKGKGAPEIPSDIKAEVSENTATLNDVQGEQRGSEMLFDTSNSSVRRSKVVIVCRTAEASVSTIEMSDSDDVVQGETSYLELTSSRSVSCQDPIDLYRNVANEEPRADVVASTSPSMDGAASFSKDLISSKEAKDVENQPQASSTEESAESAKKVLAVQPMPQNVNVTFRVHYVALVVSLEKTKDGYWTCVVGLPAESHVEWKFVVLEKGEVCRWEECENRVLYTGYGDDLLVHKWWGIYRDVRAVTKQNVYEMQVFSPD